MGDNEMALMRERVKMRQLQESMRLVTQPVLQLGQEPGEIDRGSTYEESAEEHSLHSMTNNSDEPVQAATLSSPSKTSQPLRVAATNTPSAESSRPLNTQHRLERGFSSLEAILKDIIEAVKVAVLITPLDKNESAAIGKRAKDFSARFRRISYQLKRTIATYKNSRSQLARSTFGPPLTNPQQSVMAKKTKPSSISSPKRGARKSVQRGTNIARIRRMSADSSARSHQSSSSMNRSPERSRTPATQPPHITVTPPPGRSSTQDDGGAISSSGPVEIGSVLTRLHNLELLAHMQSGNRSSTEVEAPNNTANVERTSNKGGGVVIEGKENLQDLGMMLAKIQVIKSDFDVVAQRRGSTDPIQRLHDLDRLPHPSTHQQDFARSLVNDKGPVRVV